MAKNEMQTKQKFYKLSELAKLLGVNTRTLRTMIDNGEIPSTLIGGEIKVYIEDVETWVEEWKSKYNTKEYYAEKLSEIAKMRAEREGE